MFDCIEFMTKLMTYPLATAVFTANLLLLAFWQAEPRWQTFYNLSERSGRNHYPLQSTSSSIIIIILTWPTCSKGPQVGPQPWAAEERSQPLNTVLRFTQLSYWSMPDNLLGQVDVSSGWKVPISVQTVSLKMEVKSVFTSRLKFIHSG